jgi:hypothetical protein
MNFEIKVGDKFRVAKEEYILLGIGNKKFDTTQIITVIRVSYAISYYPQINGKPFESSLIASDFVHLINDGFLVPHGAQEPSVQPAKASALNTDNAVCNQCGGRTKGLLSEFNGPRYCPECEK